MVLGFTITVLVLTSLIALFLFSRPGITTKNLPDTVPQYAAIWGPYVPKNAQLFGYENYTAIRQYNSSYPTQYSILINIPSLSLKLRSAAIDSVLTVSFASPNESIAFAFVNQAAFNNFTNALSSYGSSRVPAGSNGMYYVQDSQKGNLVFGWLGIIPAHRGIAFAIGGNDAKQALMSCLTLTQANSMIAQLNIRQMLFVANGTTGHLALGVQHFPGIVPSANSTLTVVNFAASRVQINRVLEFNSSNSAVIEYDRVKMSYLSAHLFTVYGPFVLATEYQAASDLTGAVRLVE